MHVRFCRDFYCESCYSEDFLASSPMMIPESTLAAHPLLAPSAKCILPKLSTTLFTRLRKCKCVCIIDLLKILQMTFWCWDLNFGIKDNEEDESSQRCMTLGYVTSAVPTFFFALTRFTQNLTFQGRTG